MPRSVRSKTHAHAAIRAVPDGGRVTPKPTSESAAFRGRAA